MPGCDPGDRWRELADAWAPRSDDGFCSFNDVHAMLAFVGARPAGRGLITNSESIARALRGETGTWIERDHAEMRA